MCQPALYAELGSDAECLNEACFGKLIEKLPRIDGTAGVLRCERHRQYRLARRLGDAVPRGARRRQYTEIAVAVAPPPLLSAGIKGSNSNPGETGIFLHHHRVAVVSSWGDVTLANFVIARYLSAHVSDFSCDRRREPARVSCSTRRAPGPGSRPKLRRARNSTRVRRRATALVQQASALAAHSAEVELRAVWQLGNNHRFVAQKGAHDLDVGARVLR